MFLIIKYIIQTIPGCKRCACDSQARARVCDSETAGAVISLHGAALLILCPQLWEAVKFGCRFFFFFKIVPFPFWRNGFRLHSLRLRACKQRLRCGMTFAQQDCKYRAVAVRVCDWLYLEKE